MQQIEEAKKDKASGATHKTSVHKRAMTDSIDDVTFPPIKEVSSKALNSYQS